MLGFLELGLVVDLRSVDRSVLLPLHLEDLVLAKRVYYKYQGRIIAIIGG